jgi:hypothetical protein
VLKKICQVPRKKAAVTVARRICTETGARKIGTQVTVFAAGDRRDPHDETTLRALRRSSMPRTLAVASTYR